jgi:hypothetical protein
MEMPDERFYAGGPNRYSAAFLLFPAVNAGKAMI